MDHHDLCWHESLQKRTSFFPPISGREEDECPATTSLWGLDLYPKENTLFENLKQINRRPAPFEFYTADALWTDEHTAGEMLKVHLNEDLEFASPTFPVAAPRQGDTPSAPVRTCCLRRLTAAPQNPALALPRRPAVRKPQPHGGTAPDSPETAAQTPGHSHRTTVGWSFLFGLVREWFLGGVKRRGCSNVASEQLKTVLEIIKSGPDTRGATVDQMRARMETISERVAKDVACKPVDAAGVPGEWIVPPGSADDQVILYLQP